MKKRVVYLDFLRCLAICLVIVLHSIAPVVVNTAFYQTSSWYLCMLVDTLDRMGVPLFFMISGYLMLARGSTLEVGTFYRKNLPKLLVPLAVWNLIYYLVNAWRMGEEPSLLAFASALFRQGVSSHMWFVYVLLGIYLLAPFLKRIVDNCTSQQLLVLIGIVLFYPTIRPVLNAFLPVDLYLFGPLVEGCLGYFLVGYWLGSHRLAPRTRYVLYALGIAGYLAGTVGNLMAASPESISLPMDGGYGLHHYLTSSAVFVWVQTFFSRHRRGAAAAARPLAWLSERIFGVYWVHVLVLDLVTDRFGTDVTVLQYMGLRVLLATLLSLAFAAVVSYLPGVRRILM